MALSFSQYGVVTLAALLLVAISCGGRDLRPSDHGLSYQENPSPPHEMLSFFGETPPSPPAVELPEAKNISGTWWGERAGSAAAARGEEDGAGDHVRTGLVVASGVCGLTGVVLLAVSGVVFLVRLKKQKKEEANGIPSTSAPISQRPVNAKK